MTYDKINIKVFVLGLWKNYSWNFTSFDLFACILVSLGMIRNNYVHVSTYKGKLYAIISEKPCDTGLVNAGSYDLTISGLS